MFWIKSCLFLFILKENLHESWNIWLVRRLCHTSISGICLKEWIQLWSSFTLIMVVRAMRLNTFLSCLALMHFIILGVILRLLPPMSMFTSVFRLAPVIIRLNKVFGLPIWALIFIVIELLWFPSEILPIMCVHALLSIMLSVRQGAPNSFEMKHVEVWVFSKLVEKVDSYFLFRMSECAHISIVTRVQTPWVRRTEL